MEKKNSISSKTMSEKNMAHKFIKEWKRRRMQDEKEFLKEINTCEYKKIMEALHRKIFSNYQQRQ
jgi:hypothetical protein